jgi:hypothetical protein
MIKKLHGKDTAAEYPGTPQPHIGSQRSRNKPGKLLEIYN